MYAPGWPKSEEDLQLLDEIPFDRYLRCETVREGAPKEAVMLMVDRNGTRWRAVYIAAMGWRKVAV